MRLIIFTSKCSGSRLLIVRPFPLRFTILMTKDRSLYFFSIGIRFAIKFYRSSVSNLSGFCTSCIFRLLRNLSFLCFYMGLVVLTSKCSGSRLVIVRPIPRRFTIFMICCWDFNFVCIIKSSNFFVPIFYRYSCNPNIFTSCFTSCCYTSLFIFCNCYCNLIFFWFIFTNTTLHIRYSCGIFTCTLAVCVFFFFPVKLTGVLMLTSWKGVGYSRCITNTIPGFSSCFIDRCYTSITSTCAKCLV